MFTLRFDLVEEEGGRQSPDRIAFLLADTPVGPLKYSHPAEAARNLLFDARRREKMMIVREGGQPESC